MAKKTINNVLTEAYLAELYNCAIENDYMCGVVSQYMQDEYLPSKDYQMLHGAIKQHFSQYKKAPKYGIICQKMSSSRMVTELLEEIHDTAVSNDPDSIRDQFEEFLKLVEFKKMYKMIGEKFNNDNKMEALRMFQEQGQKMQRFTLKPETFIDVAATLEDRLQENKEAAYADNDIKPITSFHIDGIDAVNQGRNLRTQLSIFLAMTGVGKSHIARWIGSQCAYVDGADVLHIQLEGSAKETLDAYSAYLTGQSAVAFETGEINSHTMESFSKQCQELAGTLKVKAYSKFGKKRSTNDVKNECEEYKRKFGKYPDVIIIDSMDLLVGASERVASKDSLRFVRLEVAEDLKDIAAETNAWIAVTYQATIEDRKWRNDEKNVLDEFNCAECHGLGRPATHLISLNRSDREEDEETMRIHIAKFRFGKKANGKTFRIATNYDKEIFYDKARSLNIK